MFLRWLLVGVLFVVGCGDLDESAVPGSLDENGCYPLELYDSVDDVCYIECDTDAECDALEAEIEAMAGGTAPEAEPTAKLDPTPEPEPTVEPTAIIESQPEPPGELEREADESPAASTGSTAEELPPFAIYAVNENLDLELLQAVDDTAVDLDEFEAIWAVIRELLPPDILVEELYEFQVFTDGPDETLAYVEPLADNPDQWLMAIDMADVQLVNGQLSEDVLHTIVHEFAHILTLEDEQVPPDPDADDPQSSTIAGSCQTFYTGEGCALPDAYINHFFFAFWDDIFDELLDIEAIEDQLAYKDALYDFYESYPDRFVTDYAATNPGEDIADSFAYFILYDEPTGSTMADEKIRFFYDYPQMVAIRDHILGQLDG